jgi:hypothetical protein
MKPLQNNTLVFVIALIIFGFSFASFLNLSASPIDTQGQAAWSLVSITLTLAGLLISPVLALGAFSGIVKSVMQPALKNKRKHEE